MERLLGAGLPSIHTHGKVGQLYENTDNGDIYELQSIMKDCNGKSRYSWVLCMSGNHIAKQNAILDIARPVDELTEKLLDTKHYNLLKSGVKVSAHYDTIETWPDETASSYRFDVHFPRGTGNAGVGKIEIYHMDILYYSVAMTNYTDEDGWTHTTGQCQCNYRNGSLEHISDYGFDVKFYNSNGSEISAETIDVPMYLKYCHIDAPVDFYPSWWELVG